MEVAKNRVEGIEGGLYPTFFLLLQVTMMREKNLDLMRQDIVSVLKNSSLAFVRELVGVDPVAVFRWAIVRAFFRYCH